MAVRDSTVNRITVVIFHLLKYDTGLFSFGDLHLESIAIAIPQIAMSSTDSP
jgi:hypothetical protein